MEKGKNGFKYLRSSIERYCEEFHNRKIKDLKIDFPDGYLPKSDHNTLIKSVDRIYQCSNGKLKKRWKEPFSKNGDLKKIAEWIGEENAKKIKFN